MAINMTALINQELAKIKDRGRTSGKSIDPMLETLAEAWKMGQYQREYSDKKRAERSEGAMNIMAATAGNYNTNYDNASLDVNIKRLENYMTKNQGNLDANAVDYYDVTVNKMKDQKALNIDFQGYQDRLPGAIENMNDYLRKLDRDKVWTIDNVDELKKMQAPLVNFAGKFRAKHGDRLNSKAYEDYNLKLDNMESMNSFLLQSALDDGFLRQDEVKAYMTDMTNKNTKASDRLNIFEDKKNLQQIKNLTVQMGDQMAEVDMYKKYLTGDGAIPHPEAQADSDVMVTINDLIEEKKNDPEWDKDKHIRYIKLKTKSLIEGLERSDTLYQKIAGEGSYIGGFAPDLLVKPTIKETPTPPKVKSKVEVDKVSDLTDALDTSDTILGERRIQLHKLKQAEKAGYTIDKELMKNIEQEISSKESEVSSLKTKIRLRKPEERIENYAKRLLMKRGFAIESTIDEYIEKNQGTWEEAKAEARRILRPPYKPAAERKVGGVPIGSTRPRD